MTDSYPWLLAMGSIASIIWLGLIESRREGVESSLSPILITDAGLICLAAGLIGARLGFVLIHARFFSVHTEGILKFWDGGFNWIGGAIGALISLVIYAATKKQSFWQLLDTLAIPAVIMTFSAWFGCLLDGCAFGKQAFYGLFTPLSPDNLGEQLHRWPIQGSGALLALGSFLILNRMRSIKLSAGVLGTLSLSMISGSNFLLTFFRGDQVPILNGFRSDAVASAVLMGLSLLACGLRIRDSKQP